MPRFPVRLKQNLAFDCLDADPDDLLEFPTEDPYNVDVCPAKRLRIERIATLCLQGRPPVIITAALKGPFEKGWKNPWTKNSGDTSKKKKAVRSVPTTALSQLPSPETARRVEHLDACEERIEAHENNVPVTYGTSEDIPFWLSRIPNQRKGFENSNNENNEPSSSPSPSRSRSGIQHIQSDGRIQLSPQKCTSGSVRLSPGSNAPKFSVSPSRDLSFSVGQAPATRCTPTDGDHPDIKTLNNVSDQANAIIVPGTTEELHHVQRKDTQSNIESTPIVQSSHAREAMPPPTFTPINGRKGRKMPQSSTTSRTIELDNASSNIRESHPQATGLSMRAITDACSPSALSQKLSRDDLQQSAERCAQVGPKRKRNTSNTPGHELVASPALGSSTGFKYKRAGDYRNKPSGMQKAKAGQKSTGSPSTGDGAAPSPKTSDQSTFSTQAAMMLAHLEFQESHTTVQPSLPSPVETPPETLGASVSCTPFSTFNAELDRQHPQMQGGQDVPISTQDLFAAASPFAFSTVKKKDPKPTSSSLKFAVFPGEEGGPPGSVKSVVRVTRSPTPSGRIPLQEKKRKVAFGNKESEKGSQELNQSWKGQLKLPHLDLGKSWENLGLSNSDLDLTDGYLGILEATERATDSVDGER